MTTSLGPICVATSASKLDLWDVEVVDENNCKSRFCPKDPKGRPNHKKLQQDRPADVVGFYGSLSSTIPRLFELAGLYKKMGAKTVAGGKHVENKQEEALSHGIDVVVAGEGEHTIRDLLLAWQNGAPLDSVSGIAFLKDGQMFGTAPRPLITDFDQLPYPDFSLLQYARMKFYPIGRIRGCNMNCEFCSVKDRTRCASPQRVMNQIAYLVENRKARQFFEVSDHFAADRDSALEFCRLVASYKKRKRVRFTMTVQTRLNDARDPELLQAMKEAGINNLAIGFESPIDEELKDMRKGYLSKDMIRWTDILHSYGFFIHGMFIFGYPKRDKTSSRIPLKDRVKRFRDFLLKAKIDTAQVILTVPLPGTDLRERLDKEGRIYPLEDIGWEYYDGQFPLFEPDDGISPEELQQSVTKIMGGFYRFRNLIKMIFNMIIHFPRMVFLASLSIVTFRVTYIVGAFQKWKRRYFRNNLMRFGGYLILKSWLKKFKEDKFLILLQEAKRKIRRSKEKFKTVSS